jgi:phage terminase large subunit-like protein
MITHISIPMSQYPKLLNGLKECSEPERIARLRNLARTDLYFLLRYLLNRPDVEHPWLFARCREVQKNPNGYLDLWSREHYKSTIITFAKTIQDILASHGDDPLPEWKGREATFGIFSFNRPGAKKFLEFIRTELSENEKLKSLFPDILYKNPDRQSPKWSLDEGIIVKRKKNQREATVEAWGLIDSMPTGSHFYVRIYDDVITEKFARSPDMIKKSTESWELSQNLGARGGFERYIGTRYHFNDTYREIMARGTAKPRIYPATEDGKLKGKPNLLTREELDQKRRDQGPYTFACQMMQNPKADEKQGFKESWIKYYSDHHGGEGMNVYILCDPANDKKKTSDYTAMWVIGLGGDNNYYCLDLYRDRLNLTERTKLLFDLHHTWNPIGVGYEKYGKDSDIAHIESEMEAKNYRFEVEPLGGQMSKNDRIKRLVPKFEQGRIYMPYAIWRTDHEGKTENLITTFIQEEYKAFPVPLHDDMLDSLARIDDMPTVWPKESKPWVPPKVKPAARNASRFDTNRR